VLAEIDHILSRHRWEHGPLDALVLDYPLRPAKALRPSLCIAAARALGAPEDSVITSAAVIELLHNAFLIHDDVEDESLFRRGEPTLQRAQGLSIAVNVADGMFALALLALLDNLPRVGLRAALAIFRAIVAMLWTTVGGQALELGWIRSNRWQFPDVRGAYEDLVVRKTASYSFIAPVEIACIAAAAPAPLHDRLVVFARHVGIAFQIADDLLNLSDAAAGYGKERRGDLWEGKRTLMLLHALAAERDPAVVREATAILARRRPGVDDSVDAVAAAAAVLDDLCARGELHAEARDRVLAALGGHGAREVKTEADVALLAELLARQGSVAYARGVAREHVEQATRAFDECRASLAAGDACDFLIALPAYVLDRLR
jgi:geranylgeranyl diphosphate synthase type II